MHKNYILVLENRFKIISESIDILLNTDKDLPESKIDQALLNCIKLCNAFGFKINSTNILPVIEYNPSEYLDAIFSIYESRDQPLEVRIKITKKISLELIDLLISAQCYKLDGISRCIPNWEDFKQILDIRDLSLAHKIFKLYRVQKGDKVPFDFEVYRQTKSISSISCSLPTGKETKKVILLYNIFKIVYSLIDNCCNRLKHLGIYYGAGTYQNQIYTYLHTIKRLCTQDRVTLLTREPLISPKMLFLEYCHPYPSKEKNLDKLVAILENLRKSQDITPEKCNKKTFAEIVYILFKSQLSIGLRRKNEIQSFKKFMDLMAQYFEMEASTFKPNNIKADALERKNKYPCFNNIKFDK